MKKIIKDALITLEKDILTRMANKPPKVNQPKEANITEVMPVDIAKFMRDNNIPATADFDGEDNGYDGWEVGTLYLTWTVERLANQSEKDAMVHRRFNANAFPRIAKVMQAKNYKRLTPTLKEIKKHTVDLEGKYIKYNYIAAYRAGDFDKLAEYFKLYFKLP